MDNPPTQNPGVTRPDESTAPTDVGAGRKPSRVRPGKARTRIILLVIAVVVVVVAGILLYRRLAAWESTDDAQIDGYIFPVSSRVSGYVTRVLVDNNQHVEAGTVLLQLDPKDYEVAVANAKATLANDQASAMALATNVPITSVSTSSQLSSAQADIQNANAGLLAAQRGSDASEATMRQAEANDLKAQDDVNRYKPLAAKDEIPQQEYTQAVNSQKATAAAVEAARRRPQAQNRLLSPSQTGSGPCRIEVRGDEAATGFGATVACRSGAG